MYSVLFNLLVLGCLTASVFVLMAVARMFWLKSQAETIMNIQCSSGDSEVMSFTSNFVRGEDDESKASKIHEAFQYIQDRRDENHEKWLKLKEEAIQENEKKDPKTLKLRSTTEG